MPEWKETTSSEHNRIIYEREIRDFLPDAILDFHVHVFNRETLPDGFPGVPVPGGMVQGYTTEELLKDMELVYPGKRCSAVVFGMPEKDFDHLSNNRYVAEQCDGKRLFPFRLLRPEEQPEAVLQDVLAQRYYGLKPYLNYVTGKPAREIEILDMVPPALMAIVDRTRRILMLHIPRDDRLADPVNQSQILRLADRFPSSKIVLAHVGRAYYMKAIVGHLGEIQKRDNIYVDISAITNWEILEYLFSHFDHKRILFGTDTPLGLFGMISVAWNDQYTYITSKPWPLSISDDHGKLQFTCFAYEMIRAAKKAVRRLALKDSFLEGLYRENGLRLLESVGL